jgi:anti-sigma B factor antagonist
VVGTTRRDNRSAQSGRLALMVSRRPVVADEAVHSSSASVEVPFVSAPASSSGPMPGLTVDASRVDDHMMVAVSGELDAYTAPALRGAFEGMVVASGNPVVDVDLSAVTFIDAAGIGVLVGEHRELEHRGGCLVLTGVPPRMHRLFELAGVAQVFTVHPPAAGTRARLTSGETVTETGRHPQSRQRDIQEAT